MYSSEDELCEFLKIKETQCAKSRIYVHQEKPILVLMLGNEEVNEPKLGELSTGVRPGSDPIRAQLSASSFQNFVPAKAPPACRPFLVRV